MVSERLSNDLTGLCDDNRLLLGFVQVFSMVNYTYKMENVNNFCKKLNFLGIFVIKF